MKSRNLLYAIFVCISVCLLASLPTRWNDYLTDSTSSLLFRLRGKRDLSENIIICYIGEKEIDNLNGWPISRDYYGYFLHKLSRSRTKSIGIDILFNQSDLRYPEYDSTFASIIGSSSAIVLPMVFEDIEDVVDDVENDLAIPMGINANYPIPSLKQNASTIGFSNFGDSKNLIKIPFIVKSEGDTLLSFGAELARLYLGWNADYILYKNFIVFEDSTGLDHRIALDENGYCRLNHFGDLNNFSSISFLELLKLNENEGFNSLFNNKLVILTVVSPGIASVKTTPFSQILPASLVHATLAENLIESNFVKLIPLYLHLLIIAIMALLGFIIWQFNRNDIIAILNIAIIASYFACAILALKLFSVLLPLFYPLASFLLTSIILAVKRSHTRFVQEQSIMTMLNDQIDSKEIELSEARKKLQHLKGQLKNESKISENTRLLSEQREKAIHRLEKELLDLRAYSFEEKVNIDATFKDIIYSNNSKMANVLELVAKVSYDDIPVLIIGETGTGKEMIARAIHHTSRRQKTPFVAVNCGALSETLLESELFGHEKGSFTGAASRRRGRFELANGGTIFLDEITETNAAFQAKLLRVLQDNTFERVGGEQTLKVNVRVIAATNKDLKEEMDKMRFRADLFYRLNGFPITIPPLRERIEDIPLLALHFLKKYSEDETPAFSGRVMELLQQYQWPGNVRELENIVRRASILAKSDGRNIIKETDLPDEIMMNKSQELYTPLETQILDALRTLEFSHSAISQTAKLLGNKDRGTITEYFRGMCFETLVQCNFDIDQASRLIAGSADKEVIDRVTRKIQSYIDNLKSSVNLDEHLDDSSIYTIPAFKGLPKNYHQHLLTLLNHLVDQK